MRKILLILFFLIQISVSEKSFSFEYYKGVEIEFDNNDGRKGKGEAEGFFARTNEFFPKCEILRTNLTGLRQGIKMFYGPDGKTIEGMEKGLFDCHIGRDGRIGHTLEEGINEGKGIIIVMYKTENKTKYSYMKLNNVWFSHQINADYSTPYDPNSNWKSRKSTVEEINHAEKLYIFYKNIDVSSPSAKNYGNKIYKLKE